MPCLLNKQDPPKDASPWPTATEVFERVHIDYLQLERNDVFSNGGCL